MFFQIHRNRLFNLIYAQYYIKSHFIDEMVQVMVQLNVFFDKSGPVSLSELRRNTWIKIIADPE